MSAPLDYLALVGAIAVALALLYAVARCIAFAIAQFVDWAVDVEEWKLWR